jgi:hypothetical protein
MTRAETLQREIAEDIRISGPDVNKYLEFAKRYSERVAAHAEVAASEVFPSVTYAGARLVASLPLAKVNPNDVVKKLEALRTSNTRVSHVFVCPHTLTLYVFGPNETPRS